MHIRINNWLAWTLAVGVAYGTATATAQDYQSPPTDPNYYTVSENLSSANADLSARVADLEKALKKIDDKAKADKEKAASQFTCTPGGRIQVDTALFNPVGPYLNKTYEPNGIEFRRLYLTIKGAGFDVIEYKFELDFAGTVPNTGAANAYPTSSKDAKIQARDLYFQINELPAINHVRVGNFYEPFSIETVSGDLVTTFMERGNPHLISPDRHIGLMAYDHILGNENTTWWFGGFCSGGDGGMDYQATDSYTPAAATGRVTWLPWYDETTEGRGLLHIGGAGTYRGAWGHQFPLGSASQRPEECHLGQTYSALMSNIDHVTELNSELLFIYGPFSFQTEYTGAFAQTIAGATKPINSCYAYFSYFLTGENRGYDRDTATTQRVKPFENFFRVRDENGCVYTGKGAWEVGYRWSYIDFHDAVSDAGRGSRFSNHTVGLNWYLNPYTRIMLNDVYSTEQQIGGALAYLNTVEMRAQISF
jgi:phosphate-selective porin OprO and OprP